MRGWNCIGASTAYNAALMHLLLAKRTSVLGLCLAIAGAAACGPVLQVLRAEDLRQRAAEAAEPTTTENCDNDSSSDGQIVIVTGCGEWDRVLKTPGPPSLHRLAQARQARTSVSRPTSGFVVLWPPVSGAAILAANGPHLNHAPHAPPAAAV